MIALVAAVPQETERLRAELTLSASDLWGGRIAGLDVVLTHTGIGKTNAAALCTELILQLRPSAMIMFGSGGAYLNSGLQTGDLALASIEFFGDEGSDSPQGFLDFEQLRLPLASLRNRPLYNRIPLSEPLTALLTEPLMNFCSAAGRRLECGPFVTVSTCSGTTARGAELESRTGGICENMEGAAAALVCLRHGVPLLEIRGISNLVKDRNLAEWDLAAANGIAQMAAVHMLSNWPKELS